MESPTKRRKRKDPSNIKHECRTETLPGPSMNAEQSPAASTKGLDSAGQKIKKMLKHIIAN